ncbi:hypothetical protein TRFO_04623 [Tritrichomonas foetus]|uniref:Uncharacterized protein n=1 Tax=Tritrichomonas foetus TaxID=1144522 RepID=A0A1J4KCA6_9EUKA|nr:hypothetical protein TRFO_04623 [Tritrichomonas foetus]|eukprot:OHT09057.1 hypothetical protein TRFO_04623 [Tritrichomonas foetus]
MNPPFTEVEVGAIRQIAIKTDNPDDASIAAVTQQDPSEVRNLIKRHLIPLRDETIEIDKIVQLFNNNASPSNNSPRRSPRLAPRPIDVTKTSNVPLAPLSASTLALPPKYRGKAMPKTPNPTTLNSHPFAAINTTNVPPPQQEFIQKQQIPVQTRIPVLPRCESSPAMISHHKKDHIDPEIGSLAAVLHPSLGPAHVCRVLAKRVQNRTTHYLVAFFQSGCSPCFVPSEYLFQLKAQVGFPLGNEEEFRKVMRNEDISVDFLLERIFSSAQNLVINHAEVLFPPEKITHAPYRPEPQQVQQIMFQCVSCAALLLVCYVSCEWAIPQDKLNLVLSTIMKTNPSKFTSTQNIMNSIQESLTLLISMIGQK